MKNRFLRLRTPLFLMLCAAPFSILFCYSYIPMHAGLWPLWPALLFMGTSAAVLVRGKVRLPMVLGYGAAVIVLSAVLLPWHGTPVMLVLPFVTAALAVGTLPLLRSGPGEELHPACSIVGGLGYLLAQMLIGLPLDDWHGMRIPVFACFFVWLLLLLLKLNRVNVYAAMAKGSAPPVSIRRRNTLVTVCAYVLIVFLSCVPAIIRGLQWTWQRIKWLIAAVIRFISSLFPVSESNGGGQGGGMSGFDMGEATEPSLLAVILEKLMYVVAGVLAAALLYLLLRTIWKRLKVLVRRIAEMLKRFTQSVSEDYLDEITDLKNEQDGEHFTLFSFGRRKKRPKPEDGDSGAWVRYHYGLLVDKHRDWKSTQTARESLPEPLAKVYEQVRYSSEPVSTEDAESFRTGTERLS